MVTDLSEKCFSPSFSCTIDNCIENLDSGHRWRISWIHGCPNHRSKAALPNATDAVTSGWSATSAGIFLSGDRWWGSSWTWLCAPYTQPCWSGSTRYRSWRRFFHPALGLGLLSRSRRVRELQLMIGRIDILEKCEKTKKLKSKSMVRSTITRGSRCNR